MIVDFKDSKIKLDPKEVASTKRVVSQFIDYVKSLSDKELAPTYYFTLLMMMHIMSQEMLDDFDEKTIKYIMERLGVEQYGNDSK